MTQITPIVRRLLPTGSGGVNAYPATIVAAFRRKEWKHDDDRLLAHHSLANLRS